MAHTLLVSIKVLTYAGCKVIYDKDDCRVYFLKYTVWAGGKEPTTGLWVLPLNPTELVIQPRRHLDDSTMLHDSTKYHMKVIACTMTIKESLIKYLHHCLFSPTKRTLVKSIKNKQLATWTVLTAAAVQKHPPELSTAKNKVHIKCQRKGLRSTSTIPDSKSPKAKVKNRAGYNPPQAVDT